MNGDEQEPVAGRLGVSVALVPRANAGRQGPKLNRVGTKDFRVTGLPHESAVAV